MGYKTLGLILEAIEDEPYREIVRRRVLAELRMRDTEPAITNEMRDRLALGYEPAHDDRPWAEGEPLAPATWLRPAPPTVAWPRPAPTWRHSCDSS